VPALLALQRAAGNRAVATAISSLTAQRTCGPSCGCRSCGEPDGREEAGREEAGAGRAATVQRDRMSASGFAQPLTEQEEFTGSRKRDGSGQAVLSCWEPQSQDFKAAANGPAVGSFDELISILKGRGTTKDDVTVIGHGTGREGGFFGFGGPVKKVGGCDEVHFTTTTGISIATVAARTKDLAVAGRALKSLTLAACNAGLDPVMVQRLADALGVCVKSFTDPVTMCLGGKPGALVRGKVRSGSDIPELASCNDFATLAPDRTTCPRKPAGAEVKDVAPDDRPGSSVDVRDDGTLTIRPVQITTLTAGGRARARAFYASQPTRYTAAFIAKMQQALGLRAPSGRIDDETLTAVADFQDGHPPLKGDGMAGPRTLSRLMRFGLASEVDEQQYANLIEDAADDFKPGSTVDERLAQAWGAVIPSLTQEQVTPMPAVAKDDRGDKEGAFSPSKWVAFISTDLLGPVPLPNDKRARLKETVYHEARHAEQVYGMARMLAASKTRSAAQITALTGTTEKPEVAIEAKTRPFERGTPEFVVAEELFDATHGSEGKRHDALERRVVAKRKERDAALKAANGDRTDPRVVKAQREYDAVFEQYADLADETDAFATGKEAQQTNRSLEL
jgi:hypothetical protein